MGKRASWSIALAMALVLLSGCEGLPPIYGLGDIASGSYSVRKGDTLYSIAFRYGLDYKRLARINGIASPYIIYPKQRIRLSGAARSGSDAAPNSSSTSKTTVAATGSSKSTTRPKVTVTTKPMPKIPSKPVSAWRWPIKGKVISGFSLQQPVNKGIDIAGKKGQSVAAAADGVVVYAGGNLRGYGKLIIIKHNDSFLSAYGNNAAMLVKEGDQIRAGKPIARVGSTTADTQLLHFEIRRDGKPENPLNYLPAIPKS